MNKLILSLTRGAVNKDNYPVESVSNSVIGYLYNIGKDDDLNLTLTYGVDTTSASRPVTSVKGSISTPSAFINQLEYLQIKYPDLKITTQTTYLNLDSTLLSYLLSGNIGDGVGIPVTTVIGNNVVGADTAELGTLLKGKTDITEFNAFNYFTKANVNPSNNQFFRGCTNLAIINLSECTKMNLYEFAESGIGSVNAPLLQEFLSTHVFYNCTSLLTVQNLGSIISIPNNCFYGCSSLTTVNIPSTCTSIGNEAFKGCSSLVTLNGLNNVTTVGNSAFEEIPLSNNVSDLVQMTSIGNNAFRKVPLTGSSLNLPNLTSLGEKAFLDLPLNITSIDCLGYITEVKQYCFDRGDKSKTYIQTVNLPYECTIIRPYAFNYAENLTSIKLYNKSLSDYAEGETPVLGNTSRLTRIENNAFDHCDNLSIYEDDIINVEYFGNYVFYINKYKSSTLNLTKATNIGRGAFRQCPNLTSITINNINCTNIEQEAFQGNTSLITADLSNTAITKVHTALFNGCSSLTTIKFPLTVTLFGVYGSASPLNNCFNVTEIRGLDNVTSILNSFAANINHAIYLKVENSDYNLIRGIRDGNINRVASIKLLYYPKYKYKNSNTLNASYANIDNGFFTYRIPAGNVSFTANVLYFKDLTKIQHYMFVGARIKNLVINNSTPPTFDTSNTINSAIVNNSGYSVWASTMFGDIPTTGNDAMTIYVPDAAVTTYQADSNYNSYTILGISNLTQYATNELWEAAGKPDDCLITEYM